MNINKILQLKIVWLISRDSDLLQVQIREQLCLVDCDLGKYSIDMWNVSLSVTKYLFDVKAAILKLSLSDKSVYLSH